MGPQVNSLGKWKTALQMVAMSLLLVLRNADHLMGDHPLCECARPVGQCLERSVAGPVRVPGSLCPLFTCGHDAPVAS